MCRRRATASPKVNPHAPNKDTQTNCKYSIQNTFDYCNYNSGFRTPSQPRRNPSPHHPNDDKTTQHDAEADNTDKRECDARTNDTPADDTTTERDAKADNAAKGDRAAVERDTRIDDAPKDDSTAAECDA